MNWHEKTLTVSTRPPLTLPLADVSGFTVRAEETTDSDGDRTTTYRVLVRRGKAPPTACVTHYSEKPTADAVANWLTAAVRRGCDSPA